MGIICPLKPRSFLRGGAIQGKFMDSGRSAHWGWRLVLVGFFVSLLWSASALSADVTLAWDPNSEPDLEGYGVYFHKDGPGPPYDLAGYITLAELNNVSAPSFVVSGLETGARYYFTATAYDTAGNESAFSNSVCADVGDTITPCPAEVSSSGGGGGGGGAGCFISASSEANVPNFLSWLALAIPGCILMLAISARQN
jgi:chitinase